MFTQSLLGNLPQTVTDVADHDQTARFARANKQPNRFGITGKEALSKIDETARKFDVRPSIIWKAIGLSDCTQSWMIDGNTPSDRTIRLLNNFLRDPEPAIQKITGKMKQVRPYHSYSGREEKPLKKRKYTRRAHKDEEMKSSVAEFGQQTGVDESNMELLSSMIAIINRCQVSQEAKYQMIGSIASKLLF